MNAQDRAAIEQMLEMLVDNREYIEANERDAYLAMYDNAIADGEILLRKPEQKVDRVRECAQRLVEHADFQLGGILSADSKTKDIPSNAMSSVKARHLAALRDALTTPPMQPSKPDYAWPTIQHYEHVVGYEVSETFKSGWAMARTTHDMFGQMMGGEE